MSAHIFPFVYWRLIGRIISLISLLVLGVSIDHASVLSPTDLAAQEGTPREVTGALMEERAYHTATLLNDGRVLVVGGTMDQPAGDGLASAELYDPQTGSWQLTDSLTTPRYGHTATLLANGNVLVAGGTRANGSDVYATVELFDPVTEQWSTTGSLLEARFNHTATLLTDGRVLVAGGRPGWSPIASAEVYDPILGIWSSAAEMKAIRAEHTATLLSTGKVLVVGGNQYDDDETAGAEIYDPIKNQWEDTGSLITGRFDHAMTNLANGEVLVVGGTAGGGSPNPGPIGSAEIYDPLTGIWRETGALTEERFSGFDATRMPNGTVLVAGGYGYGQEDFVAFAGVEQYDPATGEWHAAASLETSRYQHTMTLLQDGSLILAGGHLEFAERVTTTVERYGRSFYVFLPLLRCEC